MVLSMQQYMERNPGELYRYTLPIPEINEAIASGCQTVRELAEYFSVTESFVADALAFHTEQLRKRFWQSSERE